MRETGVACALCAVLFLVALPAIADALVNINTADQAALESLNGIGPSKATAIIEYRTEHGPFASIEDIQNVSGIGPSTYANIKDFITVGDEGQQSSDETQQDTDTQSQQQDTSQSVTTEDTQMKASAPTNSYVSPPAPSIFADAGSDRTVIVGADTVFDARAYDRDQNNVVSPVRFLWNFGDGATAEGESVLHHFSYPGRYAVFLDVAQNKEAVSDRIIVTAEPAKLAFRALPDGSVVIENDAGRDLDLSDWIVRQYAQLFMLPAHSVVLAGQSMHIPQQTLGFWANASSELAYPNGVSVLKAGESSSESAPPTVASSAQTSAIASISSEPIYKTAAASVPPASPEISVPDPDPSPAESSPTDEPEISSQGAASGLIGASSRLWWLAALILTLAAGGALIAAQHVGKREWDIVEEKPE